MKDKIIKWLRKILTYSFFVVGALFIISSLYLIFLDTIFKDKFYPRTEILGVSVTGKKYGEVREEMHDKLNSFNERIIFKSEDLEKETRPENIGIEIYLDNTLKEAFTYGREPLTWQSIQDKFNLLLLGRRFTLDYAIKEENYNNFVKTELEPLGVTASDVNLEQKGDDYEVVFGKQGKTLDKEVLNLNLKKKIEKLSPGHIELKFVSLYSQIDDGNLKDINKKIKKVLSSSITLKFEDKNWEVGEDLLKDWLYFELEDEKNEVGYYKKTVSLNLSRDKVGSYLESIAMEIETKPENARFQVKDDKVQILKPSIAGRDLMVETAYEDLKEQVLKDNRVVELETKEVGANITQESIDELGIKELVGSGSSNFAGSPRNRIHNINNAVEKLNGTFIGPQEVYSLVENIGEVNAEAGYLPELVIKENKTIPEYGGGLCQIATTLFRAAVNSGFDITERQSHSYAVSYYDPQGMDATIYIPHPDLQFINNTDQTVLLQIKVEGYNLTFEFYGTKDGREISIEGPYYWDRKGDGSFKARFTQVVKMSDGTEKRKEFKSYYDSPDKYH